MTDLVDAITEGLAATADPTRAVAMRRYVKDQFDFFGVPAPERRAVLRAALVGRAPLDQAELVAVAQRCWAAPQRELQYVACDLLAKRVQVRSADLIEAIEHFVRTRSWWDTVDALAASVVGPLVVAHPALVAQVDRWIDDPDIWIARTAILHQLQAGDRTDVDRLFRYCLRRAGDREFFLRKAIGWALRQHAWRDPAAVRAFVAAHGAELAPLSVREALKNVHRLD